MSGPALLQVGPDEVEVALVAWFRPLRPSGIDWATGIDNTTPVTPFTPFTLITLLSGTEDFEVGFGDPIVQVDTLCDKALGYDNAKKEKTLTHQRMLEFGRHLPSIVLNGWVFGADYVTVIEAQQRLPFGMTTVIRYVGRYQIGIQYNYHPVSVT
jgi:hypothetical protein